MMFSRLLRNTVSRRSTIVVAIVAMVCWSLADNLAKAGDTALREGEAAYDTIDSAQLSTLLEKKDFFFVNVHVPYEGDIPDTDANIPFDEITENLDMLPADKDAQIVLYCRSGRMSEIAAEDLSRLGYTNVSHVAGGMNGWQAAGHDLVR